MDRSGVTCAYLRPVAFSDDLKISMAVLSWLKQLFRRRKSLPPLGFEPKFLTSATTLTDAVAVTIENDDTTPMEFVVRFLEEYFQMDYKTAVEQMLKVHIEGSAQVGKMSKADANRLVRFITDLAQSYNYPLKLSVHAPDTQGKP